MEEKPSLFKSLYEKAEQYLRTTLELYKLKAVDKTANIAGAVVAGLTIVFMALLFFLLLNIAVALWIGDLLGKSYYGFFILAGFYILITLILIIFKTALLKKPVSNSVIRQILKD